MYKILHVVHDFSDQSMNSIINDIARSLTPQGFQFHVGAVTDNNDRLVMQRFEESGAKLTEFFHDSSVSQSIRAYMTANAIPIAHSHTVRTTLNLWMAIRGIRQFKHLHTHHLIHRPNNRKFGIMYASLDRFILYLPDFIMPVSKTMAEEIKAMPFISARKVFPIQNGINTTWIADGLKERDAARAEFGFLPENLVYVFSGRIELMKRVDLLLEAFAPIHARHPHARLLIVGAGSLEEPLKAQSDFLGISSAVAWAGYRSDMPRMLAAGDVYVQPSVNEGLSLSILEGMASGKTIVATDVGAAREVLVEGVNGWIVPPLNVDALREAMMRCIEEPEKARAMAAKALETVHTQFSKESMAKGYLQIYERFLRP